MENNPLMQAIIERAAEKLATQASTQISSNNQPVRDEDIDRMAEEMVNRYAGHSIQETQSDSIAHVKSSSGF